LRSYGRSGSRRQVARALLAVTFCVATPTVQGQQQPPPQRATGIVSERVTAVLVDVVVRDKRGLPVRDLTQSDFQLMEDGVPQTIGSFTSIFEGASSPAASAPAPASPAPAASAGVAVGAPPPVTSGPAVTALVFDRLSPDARRRAVQAAQGYLGSKEESRDYIAIFSVDIGLTPYAPFTRNNHVLRQGLSKMESRASAAFNSPEQQQQKANADRQAAMAGQAASNATAAAGGSGGGSAVGTASGEAQLAQMQSNMIRDFEVMERDQQGYATTNGLFAIIGALRRLPGRKSLVLFSEGISIPPAVQRLFTGVIDAANRANVSIYTMDAAGLRVLSDQAQIRDQINEAAGGGGGILETNKGGALSKDFEKNEDVLRQDTRTGLGGLAQQTGGQFFDSTNNLRPAFERIESDLRNYYLLGYTPANDTYDGRFRTISVKVNRPGVTVAARKGYFALRNTGTAPVNSWEAPALGALEQKPVPNAFPMRVGALLFPERNRPGLVAVVADLRTAPFTFDAAPDGKTYVSDFAVLTRFLDQQDQVVRKVSQHYEVKGPISEMERAKQGQVIFYREPELAPGVYTMETIAYDTPSGKASVRFSTVEVPKADPSALRMSSLVLVKRAEKVPEKDRRPDNPLLVNDVLIYPNLGEPVSKASKELGFYFTAYPATGKPAAVSKIELLQDERMIAEQPMPLAGADASGRIQQVGRLPLDLLAPGNYEFRVVLKQGDEQVVRSASFHLTE
jgi:VWFA-related protein